MPKKVCSFCGRSEKDVNLLITGLNGFICDACAQQAYQIVMEAGFGPVGNAQETRIRRVAQRRAQAHGDKEISRRIYHRTGRG